MPSSQDLEKASCGKASEQLRTMGQRRRTARHGGGAWLRTASELTVAESRNRSGGSSAIVDRLAEVLLLQVLGDWAATAGDQAGFLSALSDPAIARALRLIHAAPAEKHSLGAVATEVGYASEFSLARAFKRGFGEGPGAYRRSHRLASA